MSRMGDTVLQQFVLLECDSILAEPLCLRSARYAIRIHVCLPRQQLLTCTLSQTPDRSLPRMRECHTLSRGSSLATGLVLIDSASLAKWSVDVDWPS